MTAAPPHHCGNCPARWSGFKFCHCRECHQTFSTPANFDTHRVGALNDRSCSLQKLRMNDAGVWVTPGDKSLSVAHSPRGDGVS